MSVAMSLLALLDESPNYGLQLRNLFEERTGGVWPLNVGQVYTTLARLERDGFVRRRPSDADEKLYEMLPAGRRRLREWFATPTRKDAPERDALVLKLVLALGRSDLDAADVIQAERKAAVELLQQYTKLKRDGTEHDLGWLFLLDSLIFQAEARVRWLDMCEERLTRTQQPKSNRKPSRPRERIEVKS
ncbi:MAG: helix-turn-helix transcriptional regulator [Actinomycetota bacterium]|nr:PadR family transcriptional regulator [Actinomycetota bacterium]